MKYAVQWNIKLSDYMEVHADDEEGAIDVVIDKLIMADENELRKLLTGYVLSDAIILDTTDVEEID